MTTENENTGAKSLVWGGLSEIEQKKFKGTIDAKQSKMDTLAGEMSAEWEKVEKAGGNKAAFKLALKLTNMEQSKAFDFINSLNGYLTGLGLHQQMDLFEQEQATKVGAAPQPQRTADAAIKEARTNNGQAIAEAVMAH